MSHMHWRCRMAAAALAVAAASLPLWSPTAVAATATTPATSAATTTAADKALPLELAYGRPQVLGHDEVPVAVAPDGKRVAYVVRTRPGDLDVRVWRWTNTGTPNVVTGAQIHISDTATGQASQACDMGGHTWRPAWSPDSSTLAFYSDAGGKVGLWAYDTATGQCRPVSDAVIKPKLWIGDEPQWSPDSRYVYVPLLPEGKQPGYEIIAEMAAKAEKKPGDLALYVSGAAARAATEEADSGDRFLAEHLQRDNNAALGRIEMASGEVRVVARAATQPLPSVMRLSPSGKWLSYLSVFYSPPSAPDSATLIGLAVVPSAGGQVKVIADDLPSSRRDYYRLNYTWHPTQDRLLYFRDGQVHLVDFDASGPRRARRVGEGLGPLAQDVHFFTRDGRAAIVQLAAGQAAGGRGGDTVLAVVPIDGGEPKRIRIDPALWQFEALIRADASTAWQPEERTLSLRLRDAKTGEVVVARFDIDTGQHRPLWKGRAELRGLTTAADGKDLFGLYEDIAQVGNVHRFSTDFQRGAQLSNVAPELKALSRPRVEVFTTRIPFHDHTLHEVRTAVLLPERFQPGRPVPAVVSFYPGADATRELDTYGGGNQAGVPAMVYLSRGYAVVYPHIKLGPGGAPGNVVDEIVDALLPQVYAAIERGYVDPNRLALQGNSFGGFATAAITTRTQLFRAAVPTNGVYDLVGHTYQGALGNNIGWTENNQPRIGTHYWEAPMRYLDNSPLHLAHKIQTPMLILQGGDDRLRPEAEALFAALKRLDKTAELAIYERSGHWLGLWPQQQAVGATQRVLDFFETHLGAVD